MASVETRQMSAVETGQMTAAETSLLSQQKTSVLSQCCSQLLPAAAGCPRLTQAMKSKLVDHFLLEKLKVFCPIPFVRSTSQEVVEGNINSDFIL